MIFIKKDAKKNILDAMFNVVFVCITPKKSREFFIFKSKLYN